jgi:hypothetical protein
MSVSYVMVTRDEMQLPLDDKIKSDCPPMVEIRSGCPQTAEIKNNKYC